MEVGGAAVLVSGHLGIRRLNAHDVGLNEQEMDIIFLVLTHEGPTIL